MDLQRPEISKHGGHFNFSSSPHLNAKSIVKKWPGTSCIKLKSPESNNNQHHFYLDFSYFVA